MNSKIHEIVFTNPNKFLGTTYCYYVYQGVLNKEQITPELFSRYIKGGSLSFEFVNKYKEWLNTMPGKECKKDVGKNFTRIKIKNKKRYGVYLNQIAIKEEGKSIELTRNHERLHVAFAIYKEGQGRIKQKWDKLPKSEKQGFVSRHPGYNFKNKNTLLKEYFSYTYQNNLEKGLKFLKD